MAVDQPLVLGKDLSFEPLPKTPPNAASPTILVIGGGVTGLVTAWVLLDKGYHVTVVAREWASFTAEQRLTSQIAGALWEFPPAVCGQHSDPISLSHSKRWSIIAYRIWDAMARDPEIAAAAGVRIRSSNFCFPFPIEENLTQLIKMHDIERSGVRGFNRSRDIVQKHDINPHYGAVDGYELLAPVIDTDRCMEWLMALTKSKGANFHTESINNDILSQEEALLDRFSANAIVNCTGLSAMMTANDDTCYPLRGALIRVINDGKDFPQVNSALAIAADVAHENEVFIVPRNDNILIIGGIAEPYIWNIDLTLESPQIRRMRDRADAFLPRLKHARVDPAYPLAQSLRPNRERNVRVERELRQRTSNGEQLQQPSRIIHSYGHGGAGWSLSFGCAADVARLVEDILHNVPAESMKIREEAKL